MQFRNLIILIGKYRSHAGNMLTYDEPFSQIPHYLNFRCSQTIWNKKKQISLMIQKLENCIYVHQSKNVLFLKYLY